MSMISESRGTSITTCITARADARARLHGLVSDSVFDNVDKAATSYADADEIGAVDWIHEYLVAHDADEAVRARRRR